MNKLQKISELSQNEELLTALDLFDLDESVIDDKLSEVMQRKTLKNKHFNIILSFIKYKYIISTQEETDCENDTIIQFALKQIIKQIHLNDANHTVIDALLEILSLALSLNKEKIQANVEHIIQQILSLTDSNSLKSELEISTTIEYLNVLNSILNVSVTNNLSLESRFVNDEIMSILTLDNTKINALLLSKTIPKILHCCNDSNILNIIWEKMLINLSLLNLNHFVTICSLSDYYFPLDNEKTLYNFKSNIAKDNNFWLFIQHGLNHDDYSTRKCAIFLAKKAVEYSSQRHESFVVNTNERILLFVWDAKKKLILEKYWSNYFVLLETLEEKQAHLVMSAMHVFENLGDLPQCWHNCALRRALLHESHCVKLKTVERVLQSEASDKYDSFPFNQLLQALNTISFYENALNYNINKLIPSLKYFLSRENIMKNVIEQMNSVDWSPIPKFYMCYSLMCADTLKGNLPIATIAELFHGQSASAQNNLYIRHATHSSLVYFVINQLLMVTNTGDFLHLLQTYIIKNDLCQYSNLRNDVIGWIKRISFNENNTEPINAILSTKSCENMKPSDINARVQILMILLESGIIKRQSVMDLIDANIYLINESTNRQYAQKTSFDHIFFFIVSVLDICSNLENFDSDKNNDILRNITKNYSTIINFVMWRCHSLSPIDNHDLTKDYVNGLNILLNKVVPEDLAYLEIDQLMGSSIKNLCDSGIDFTQKYISIEILSKAVTFIHISKMYPQKLKREKLETLYPIIELCMNVEVIGSDKEMKGKLISDFKTAYSKICYYYYETLQKWDSLEKVVESVHDLLQTGGYGCLVWVIKTAQLILPELAITNSRNVDSLVNRIWTEVFGVRKNENFKICIAAFIEMTFQKEMFAGKQNHELLVKFIDKIFELGELSPFVIQEFMKNLCSISRDVKLDSYITLLSKAVLFGTVSRKDQRIETDTCVFIGSNKNLNPSKENARFVNPLDTIRTLTTSILMVQDMTIHDLLSRHLKEKLDAAVKSKNRYHGNSIHHRTILRTLQSLLLSYILYPTGKDVDHTVTWCIAFLTKQPHHISARILLEWYIALALIHKKIFLNRDMIDKYQLSQLPQLSYFMIIYHIAKHQLINSSGLTKNEMISEINVLENKEPGSELQLRQNNFHFAMNLLMPHTMGQLFNVRLHAQFLALKLFELPENIQNKEKYQFIVSIIIKTFQLNMQEKTFIRIQEDFYINNFDVVCNLSLENIYHHIPRLTGVSIDELVTLKCVKLIDVFLQKECSNNAERALISMDKKNMCNLELIRRSLTSECLEIVPAEECFSVNVQKKFVPWKNMLEDLGITFEEEMERKTSGLIVVASLVDRMPNLGGLARTCEVFGVKKFIIDNLHHTQDKIFQNLSVSSERWIDIGEVKPGTALKTYLISMKEKGYSIIGVEQTASSICLNKFSFPKKSVLLLGHEKVGVPSNLLNLMDYCVEIPQYGKIRSLNVHVTASIFIWEYGKQHPL